MGMRALMVLSVLSLGVAITLFGWDEAFVHTEEMEVHYRAGTDLVLAGEWREAIGELRLALPATRMPVRIAAHHNLGLAYLQMSLAADDRSAREWTIEAIHHQEETLRLQPGLHDAAWNLELALRRLEELEASAEAGGAGEAERLLASFRLQEEESLSQTLLEKLRSGFGSTLSVPKRGPQW